MVCVGGEDGECGVCGWQGWRVGECSVCVGGDDVRKGGLCLYNMREPDIVWFYCGGVQHGTKWHKASCEKSVTEFF